MVQKNTQKVKYFPRGCYDIPPNSHHWDKHPIHFHIDTFTCTGVVDSLFELLHYLYNDKQYLKEVYERNYGGYVVTHRVSNVNNSIIVEYGKYGDEGGYWTRITLNGSYLETMCFLSQVRIIYNLTQFGGFSLKATRVDLALDDYNKHLSAIDLWNNSEYIRFFKKKEIIKSGDIKTEDSELNTTVYFGSKRKKLRVYNTLQKHDYDATRFELQLRENYALCFIDSLQLSVDAFDLSDDYEVNLTKHMINFTFGFFDFLYYDDNNLDRCRRLEFWESFLNYIDVNWCKTNIIRVKSSLDNKFAWMQRQVAKTITMIAIATTNNQFNEYLQSLFINAKKRYYGKDFLWQQEFINYFQSLQT